MAICEWMIKLANDDDDSFGDLHGTEEEKQGMTTMLMLMTEQWVMLWTNTRCLTDTHEGRREGERTTVTPGRMRIRFK